MAPVFEVPSLRSLARHALPTLLEATILPLVVFYSAMWVLGLWGALVAGLLWSYGAIVRRLVAGRGVPAVLALGAIALTVRTVLALASGSVAVYFLQPTLGTVAMAGAFLVSVRAGRPMAQRLAADFFPLPDHVLARPWVQRFFDRISIVWGLVQLVNAGVTVWLVLSQPVGTYVIAKTVVSLVVSGSVIAGAVLVFTRLAARDHTLHGLPGGRDGTSAVIPGRPAALAA